MLKKRNNIIVQEGFIDDDTGVDLSGWQGRITEIISDEIIEVEWDSITLKGMPEAFIIRSIKEGYDYFLYSLNESDVALSKSRDTEQETKKMQGYIDDKYYWYEFGEEGERIMAVLATAEDDEDDLMVWERHLKVLQLPMAVEYVGEDAFLFKGNDLVLKTIIESEDDYELIGVLKGGKQVPLHDLSPVEKNENTQILEDYSCWFTNNNTF